MEHTPYEFDRRPGRERVVACAEPSVELQTAFDGGWMVEMLVDDLAVRMAPAQAYLLGLSLLGLSARVAALDAESSPKGH